MNSETFCERLGIVGLTKNRSRRSRTVCFVAPFGDVVQAAALVDLDAAIACLVRSVIAAFTRVAAADGSGGDEQRGDKGEQGEVVQRGGYNHGN